MSDDKFELHVVRAEHGLQRIDFVDYSGASCSLQMSSLSTEAAIRFGCDSGAHVDGACSARMHLTQEMVRQLLPYLQRFAATGEIGDAGAGGQWVMCWKLKDGKVCHSKAFDYATVFRWM